MTYKVFTEAQVEQFIDRGWVKLESAFPRENALAAQDFLWARLAKDGVLKDDPSTWVKPMISLQESYNDPVFLACQTERLTDAIEDLVGAGRCADKGKSSYWGWWPVNFSVGADQLWTVPTRGWHWDGQHFRHAVDAPDQGLLLLPIFSEIGPHGGGTLVAEGSHQVVARLLAEYPEGVEQPEALNRCAREHPWLSELSGLTPSPEGTDRNQRFMETVTTDAQGTRLRVIETTAGPGDVILCHPFLYHAASQNHSHIPRFMCNRTTPLTGRMRVHVLPADAAPIEISIHRALTQTNRP